MRKYMKSWAGQFHLNGIDVVVVVDARNKVHAAEKMDQALAYRGAAPIDADHIHQVCIEPWQDRARHVVKFTRYLIRKGRMLT